MDKKAPAPASDTCVVCGQRVCARVTDCVRQYVRDFWKA